MQESQCSKNRAFGGRFYQLRIAGMDVKHKMLWKHGGRERLHDQRQFVF